MLFWCQQSWSIYCLWLSDILLSASNFFLAKHVWNPISSSESGILSQPQTYLKSYLIFRHIWNPISWSIDCLWCPALVPSLWQEPNKLIAKYSQFFSFTADNLHFIQAIVKKFLFHTDLFREPQHIYHQDSLISHIENPSSVLSLTLTFWFCCITALLRH